MDAGDHTEAAQDLAEAIADLARSEELTVGTAESLTGGQISAALSAAPAASEWFRGGVVAYSSQVKFDLLKVPVGPVVSEPAATAMAAQARRLLQADVVVAVTGAGGPQPQDDQPPGTVFVAVDDGRQPFVLREQLDGDPAEVCARTTTRALAALLDRLRTAADEQP